MSTLRRGHKYNCSVLPDEEVEGKFRQLESPHFFNYDQMSSPSDNKDASAT